MSYEVKRKQSIKTTADLENSRVGIQEVICLLSSIVPNINARPKITKQSLLWRTVWRVTIRLSSGVGEWRGHFLLIETSFMEEIPVGSCFVWESVIIKVSVADNCLSKLLDGFTYLLAFINHFLIIKDQRFI